MEGDTRYREPTRATSRTSERRMRLRNIESERHLSVEQCARNRRHRRIQLQNQRRERTGATNSTNRQSDHARERRRHRIQVLRERRDRLPQYSTTIERNCTSTSNNSQRRIEIAGQQGIDTVLSPDQNNMRSGITDDLHSQATFNVSHPLRSMNTQRTRTVLHGVHDMNEANITMPETYRFSQSRLSVAPNMQCPNCASLLWIEESKIRFNCCDRGKSAITRLQTVPRDISQVFNSALFHKRQRSYNGMFAFSALGAGGLQRKTWTQPNGPSALTMHGRAYHRIFDLQESYGHMNVMNNARMYIYDGEFEDRRESLNLDNYTTQLLKHHVHNHIPWARQYRTAVNTLEVERPTLPRTSAFIEFDEVSRSNDGNVIGEAPHAREIAALLYTDHPTTSRRRVITYPLNSPDSNPRCLPLWSPCYESLQYPLLFLSGESGWSSGSFDEDPPFKSKTMCRLGVNPVSLLMYSRQRILSEPTFTRNSRIAQEWMCDMFSRYEEHKLSFFEHQSELQTRVASFRAVHESRSGTAQPGKLLPFSFHGSPLKKQRDTQDALAIVNRRGKPHLFITITCNPEWPEIRDNLLSHQQAHDRPDLCCRVFKIKLGEIMKDLKSGRVFGPYDYSLHVVEFQKRGLPHAHLVIKFQGDGPAERGDIDKWVWAMLPPRSLYDGKLREKVIKFMIHKPCGVSNPSAPCMEKDRKSNRIHCSKHFPQKFRNTSAVNDTTGRVEYKRLQNGDITQVRQKINGVYVNVDVDNRWVVAYNPYLLMKYDCHINVDIISTAAVLKYLFKYCLKGADFTRARIAGITNEIEQYRSTRYVSATEACWRLLGFHMLYRNPSVTLIQAHLENEQNVVFGNDATPEQRLSSAHSTVTDLMRYFRRPATRIFDSLTILDYYENFTIKKRKREEPVSPVASGKWLDAFGNTISRRVSDKHVCRIQFKNPTQGDLYYLRLLLHHVPTRSFQDLRTYNDIVHTSFQSVAVARGLVSGNQEYFMCLEEAKIFRTGRQLRNLFVTLILDGAPAPDLWNRFESDLLEDLTPHHSPEACRELAFRDIDLKLHYHGKTTSDFNLPAVVHRETELQRLRTSFDNNQQRLYASDHRRLLTTEQQHVFTTITNAVNQGPAQPFMIDAPAGTGKTFVEKVIASHLRSEEKVVVTVASTGIAALQLPGGRTAHSMFKFPVDDTVHPDTICNISAESQRADVLRQCDLIIWDELPMTHKYYVEALDRTLRDFMGVDDVFGGKTVLFSGDWRQTSPIVKFGSPADSVEAAVISSPLWCKIQRLSLTQSQRDRQDLQYSSFVRAVGENRIPTETFDEQSDIMPLSNSNHSPPNEHITLSHTHDFQDLIDFVYPQLDCNHAEYHDRAILATTNAQIDTINDFILDKIPGPNITFRSADSALKSDDNDDSGSFISPDILNNISVQGVPPHELRLKEGVLAMVTRNVNFSEALVNGQKCVVRGISQNARVLQVEILNDDRPIVLLPRINFTGKIGRQGIEFQRVQYPIRVAYSVTINKSQGQTLSRVGLDLTTPVFAHGQLYVALSRVRNRRAVKCLLPHSYVHGSIPYTENVVYDPFVEAATGNSTSPRDQNTQQSPLQPPSPSNRTAIPPSSHPHDFDNHQPSPTHQPPLEIHLPSPISNSAFAGNLIWDRVPEIGDGACGFRALARAIYADPNHHPRVRREILSFIQEQGESRTMCILISAGIGVEPLTVLHQPPKLYDSFQHYLQIMSHPQAFMGQPEIHAAELLYNVNIEVHFSTQPLPPPPLHVAPPNRIFLLFSPTSLHYDSLRLAPSTQIQAPLQSPPPAPPQIHPPSPPASQNWHVVREVGDGACGFRAISRILFGTPNRHLHLRRTVMTFITTNQPFMDHFISPGIGVEPLQILGQSPVHYASFHHYVQIMSHPQSFLGVPEIAAIEHMFSIKINIIHDTNLLPVQLPQTKQQIYILYSPNHYSSIVTSSTSISLPS